jgi:hypothetical protein
MSDSHSVSNHFGYFNLSAEFKPGRPSVTPALWRLVEKNCRCVMSQHDVTMRTVIDVPDEIIRSLDRVSNAEKRSRAALIRDAITEYLRVKSVPATEAAFGIWKSNPTDGIQYQNNLRDEWEDR